MQINKKAKYLNGNNKSPKNIYKFIHFYLHLKWKQQKAI